MDAFRKRIAGTIVEPADAEYETVRRGMLWNQLVPPRGPELIVRAASEADVVEAVRFARAHGHRVAVRGGGHSWCGTPLRDGGMLLDLGRLDQVEIDPAARVARVQPAVRGGDLARRLAPHGLAFPFGHCPTVPLSGYLLSGGLGWNAGTWGPACLSVQGIDVVTADGRLLAATEAEHADLLWAARGAGPGFFGVVTRYHLRLHALPRAITTSTYVHALERTGEVLDAAAALAPALPPSVELAAFLAAAPPPVLARAAASGGRACIVSATAFADDDAEAAAALAPLAESPVARGCLLAEERRPTSLKALFELTAAAFPERHRYLAEAVWTNTSPATALAGLAERLVAAPSPSALVICGLATGSARPLPDIALSMPGGMLVLCYAVWESPRDDVANHEWHRAAVAALEPFVVGRYVGESERGVTASHAAGAFSATSWQRLEVLRRTWDPDGLFRGWLADAAP